MTDRRALAADRGWSDALRVRPAVVQLSLATIGLAVTLLAGPLDLVAVLARSPALLLGIAAAWLWPRRAGATAADESGEAAPSLGVVPALARLAELGELGVWSWDLRTGSIRYDDVCAQMLGHAAGTLSDSISAWGRLVHEDDLARVRTALDAHLEGRSERYEVLVRVRAADRSWRWILDVGRVVERGEAGDALRAVGVHVDVTAMVDQAVALELEDDGGGAVVPASPAEDAPAVLVVDDELPMRLVSAAMLQRLGYRPVLAEDGAHALEVYEAYEGQFAAVLSDVQMPALEGRALARELRARGFRGSLILASGVLDPDAVAGVVEVDGFLRKPFDLDALTRLFPATASSKRED